MSDFDTYYGVNPWEAVDKNQREWYFPEVAWIYNRDGVYGKFVPWTYNMANIRAKTAHVTKLLPPHADANQLELRRMWVNPSYIDSVQVDITLGHYGGKVAYHKWDEIVTYWKMKRRAGVRRIMKDALGKHMVDTLDILGRNAYIKGALTSEYATFAGNATSFSDLSTADLFSPDHADDVWLRMLQNDVVEGVPGSSGAPGTIYCITSPGVIYDIRKSLKSVGAADAWSPVDPKTAVSRYEVGMYSNVRFIMSNRAILWNSGTIIFQETVVAPITAGDGAPDPNTTKVDGYYAMGQAGSTHFLKLSGTPAVGVLGTDLKVGDMVTIHLSKNTDTKFGVTGGVDFRDGRNHVRRVVSIDTVNNQIVLDKPIMIDMSTDLGGGVYAFVTKGRNVHSSLFIGGPNAVVGAVGQAPMFHAPPAVDDFEAMQRFSWDGFFGLNVVSPEKFEVVMSAGSTRVKGATTVQ